LGLPIALKLQRESCDVTVGQIPTIAKVSPANEEPETETRERKRRRLQLYDGLIKKLSADELVRRILREPDPSDCFVLFDDNGQFRYADQLRGRGFHGNFPTAEDHHLETNRTRAKEFAATHYAKLNVAQKHEFKRIDAGIQFLRKSDDLWVLKALGEGGRTIVPDVEDSRMANDQLIEALQINQSGYEANGYLLELFINPVVELTPEKIYYNGKPVCTTVDIENKPLGSGNLSVQTGCAADMVFATDFEDKINTLAFPEIVDKMAREHEGLFVWDASLLIDARRGKVYFGEYCANRFGYNALFTEMALAGGSPSRFFESIVAGRNPFRSGDVGVSVRLFNLQHDSKGNYVAGQRLAYPEPTEPNLWLWDVRKTRNGLETVGFGRNVLVAAAAGPSVTEAINRLYKAADNVALEGVYYRPKFDYVSRDYPTAILNRLDYGLRKNMYKIGFAL
jgi:phosphoribosylamine-glycine ligase